MKNKGVRIGSMFLKGVLLKVMVLSLLKVNDGLGMKDLLVEIKSSGYGNMSWSVLGNYLHILLTGEYIIFEEDTKKYKITSKGIDYLSELLDKVEGFSNAMRFLNI